MALQAAAVFGEEYFHSHLGPLPYDRNNIELVHFFSIVADQIIRSLRPSRVLDAGCAMGFLVEAFWDRGVAAWGIDISEYAISKVRRDMTPYCRVASLTDPVEGTYDLITCIEVLEHLPEAESLAAIRNLARATDKILFSSSPTDVTEPTHINVHQPLWWLEQFQQAGFAPDLTYDAGYITPHAFLLRKVDRPAEPEVLRLFSELLRYKLAHAEQNRRAAVPRKLPEVPGDELEDLRRTLSALTERHAILLREMERLTGGEPQSLENLHAEVATIRTEAHHTNSALSGVRSELETMRADAAACLSGLEIIRSEVEARTAALTGLLQQNRAEQEQARASLARQLDEVLHSRIWRTLTKVGAVVLRFRGGR